MKKRDQQRDYIKASRKGSRDAEIGMYGRPLGHNKVHRSKKTYNRKAEKAALKKLPFPFYIIPHQTATSLLNS